VGERIFPVGKEVETMFAAIEEPGDDDRAPNRSAEVVEGGWVDDGSGSGEVAERSEGLGVVGLECTAVEFFGAGFGGGEDCSAAALAVLGGEGSGEDLKLFGGVGGGDETVGAVDAHVAGKAVDDDGVGDGTAASEREIVDVGVVLAGAGSAGEGFGNEELVCTLGAGLFGEVDELLGAEFAADLGVGVIEGASGAGDGNNLGGRSEFEGAIDDLLLIEDDVELVGNKLGEAVLLEADRVTSGLKEGDAIGTSLVGDGFILSGGAVLMYGDGYRRQNCAAGIFDDAAD